MTHLSFQENKALICSDAGMALLFHALYQPTEEKVLTRAKAYAENPLCRVFYALEGETPQGLCIIQPNDQSAEILILSVAKEYQGRGVGRALVAHIQRQLKIPLTAETDDEAVGFYRRCGFSVTSLGKKYPGVIRYRCILAKEA